MRSDEPAAPNLSNQVLTRYLHQRRLAVIDLQDRRQQRDQARRLLDFLKVSDPDKVPLEFQSYIRASQTLFHTIWQIQNFPELEELRQTIATAQHFYRPDTQARSRVSDSMFLNWAHYDLKAGRDAKSLADYALAILQRLDQDPETLVAARQLTRSRLGVYEVCVRIRDRGCERLTIRELVTGHTYSALDMSGAAPGPGQLWLARLLPPTPVAPRHWVSMMSPYAVRYWDREAWDLCLGRQRRRWGGEHHAAIEGSRLHQAHAIALKQASRQVRGPLASRNLWMDFAHFWGKVHPRGWVELQGIPDQIRHVPLRQNVDAPPAARRESYSSRPKPSRLRDRGPAI